MNNRFSRRQFIKVSTIGIAAAGAAVAAGKMISGSDPGLPDPYPVLPDNKPVIPAPSSTRLFFNEHQYNLVTVIADLIVPADEDPGATDAGVAGYIDKLAAGSEKKQRLYSKGLAWVDKVSLKQYDKDFLSLSIKEQIELFITIEKSENMYNRPVSSIIERINKKIDLIIDDLFGIGYSSNFFREIRKDVFHGYYSSPLSWKAVGYYGPPQPAGYPDYSYPPSSEKYIDTVYPVNNSICTHCHFDQQQIENHIDKSDCMDCHEPHSPLEEYITNG